MATLRLAFLFLLLAACAAGAGTLLAHLQKSLITAQLTALPRR